MAMLLQGLTFSYESTKQDKSSGGVGEFIFSAKPAFTSEKRARAHPPQSAHTYASKTRLILVGGGAD